MSNGRSLIVVNFKTLLLSVTHLSGVNKYKTMFKNYSVLNYLNLFLPFFQHIFCHSLDIRALPNESSLNKPKQNLNKIYFLLIKCVLYHFVL